MAYEKIEFVNQTQPGISAQRLNHMQTQYDEAVAAAEVIAAAAAGAVQAEVDEHLAEIVQYQMMISMGGMM